MKKFNFGIAQPKYELISKRIEHIAHLSLAKMVAHATNPLTAPMTSDKKSLEYVFHDYYKKLPKSAQKKFLENATKLSNVPTSEVQRKSKFGDLADIDFKSKESIAEQAKQMKFPPHLIFTKEENEVIARKIYNKRILPSEKPNLTPIGNQRIIRLSVDNIHCIETLELKKDEIMLNGLLLDALGNSTAFDLIDVGKMKDGDTVVLGTKGQLSEVNLNIAGFFPQTLSATFFLLDKDIFSDQDAINDAFKTCAIIAGTLSGIGVTTIGIAIGMALTGGALPIAAGLVTAAVIALAASFAVLLIGGGITIFLAAESSIAINDQFLFDLNPVTLQPGEFDIRKLNADILGFRERVGKYTFDVKWERIS